jgi:hypothetical protein
MSAFRILGFLLNLIYSVPFLLSSSLGAGLGKRTQKLLGAHQERISIANEREDGCLKFTTKSRFLYSKFDIIRSLYINASFHHSLAHYFALQDKKEISPKIRELILLAKQRNF